MERQRPWLNAFLQASGGHPDTYPARCPGGTDQSTIVKELNRARRPRAKGALTITHEWLRRAGRNNP